MSIRVRIATGFVGLAMVAPAAMADDPVDGPAVASTAPAPAVSRHTHKGMFGWRHCVECQRARARSRDGIDIPAPPSLDPGVVPGGMAAACPTCQKGAVMASSDPHAPGYAAVGGDPGAPGFAVVGEIPGAEPAPVGMATARPHGLGGVNMAGTGPRPGMGPYDPSVTPASVPPAQVALAAPRHERPHIISHLFGLPKLGGIHRAYEDQERSRHAAISYGQADKPVTELPASMVYPGGAH